MDIALSSFKIKLLKGLAPPSPKKQCRSQLDHFWSRLNRHGIGFLWVRKCAHLGKKQNS